MDLSCLTKQFYHVYMILDKYHKPKLVVLAPPTYMLECLCKENGPLTHLLWILVFDDQHNQIGLMNLQVFVL